MALLATKCRGMEARADAHGDRREGVTQMWCSQRGRVEPCEHLWDAWEWQLTALAGFDLK